MKLKTKVNKTIYTFAYLRSVSKSCFEQANKDKEGRHLFLAASIVFSAFTLEAFFNHIGDKTINNWSIKERKLSPFDKLSILAKKHSIKIDFGKRPYQSVKLIFQLRDALAHGKTTEITKENYQHLNMDLTPILPLTNWEKLISLSKAEKYLADVKTVVEEFSHKGNIDSNLLYTPIKYNSLAMG